MPLVSDAQSEIYNRFNLNFVTLSHLESIGLVQFNNIAGFHMQKLPKKFSVLYYGRLLTLEMKNEADNMLELGTCSSNEDRKRTCSNKRKQTCGWILGLCN